MNLLVSQGILAGAFAIWCRGVRRFGGNLDRGLLIHLAHRGQLDAISRLYDIVG